MENTNPGKYNNPAEEVLPPAAPLIDLLMQYEDGALDEAQEVALMQELIDNGYAWQLQSFYGRRARQLILEGKCHERSSV